MENLVKPCFETNSLLWRSTMTALRASYRLYVVFITPRSGSTWLTQMATCDGRLGSPDEWFNFGIEQQGDINDYVHRITSTYASASNLMGVELDYYQAEMLAELMEDPEEGRDTLSFFYLRRRNIVAQAISLYRSAASGFWHSYDNVPGARERFEVLDYDGLAIKRWLEEIMGYERSFERMFPRCGISPRRFFYEDMQKASSITLEWIYATVAQTQNVQSSESAPPVDVPIKPISDDKNQEWEARFRADYDAYLASELAGRPPLTTDLELEGMLDLAAQKRTH